MNQQYQNQPNETDNPIPVTSPIESNNHKKIGPIIVVLVLLLIIIIAISYLFSSNLSKSQSENGGQVQNSGGIVTTECLSDPNCVIPTQTSIVEPTTKDVEPLTNTSDGLKEIQDDLNVSIDGLDTQGI